MAQYKEKYKQFVVNSAKKASYYFKKDIAVFNLNACFTKKNNYVKFMSAIKDVMEHTNKINLCNLASLCYKLNIPYNSDECYELISKIVELIRSEYPDAILLQNKINNAMEIDLQPIHDLILYDRYLKDEMTVEEVDNQLIDTDEDGDSIIYLNKLEKDVPNNLIIVNHVLMESLKYIGYASTQVFDIFDFTKDFNEIIPRDIIETLPIDTEENMNQYNKISKLFE